MDLFEPEDSARWTGKSREIAGNRRRMAPGGPRVIDNCKECLRSRCKDDPTEEDINLNNIVDIYASKFQQFNLSYSIWCISVIISD